jgi:hypothetical protein
MGLCLLGLGMAAAGAGCAGTAVKPWQKERLAPAPMQLDDCKTHRFERNSEAYREGAVGATGGKSGGGCGCS